MSSLRAKKILNLVQTQSQAPVQNDILSLKLNDISAQPHVTALSDVKNKPENLRFSDVTEYFAQTEPIFNKNVSHNIMDVESDQHDPRENQPPPDFENSDMDFSDMDPTFSPPKQKKKPSPVYPGRGRSSSSSSSNSSTTSTSTSSSSSQSSIESTITVVKVKDTWNRQMRKTHTRTNILKSISIDQDNRGKTRDENTENETEANKKGRKRKKNENKWKQNIAKALRNTGKEYVTKKKTTARARAVNTPCTEKCRIKCFENFTDEQRQRIFDAYWNLGDTNSKRSFIMSCMSNITPKYKYTNTIHPRNCNKAFHFTVQGKSVRVCKTFFMRTLDISDRVIRTVKHKNDENGMIINDLRGKHSNHSRIDETIKNDMKQFIEAIPRMESHYTRQNSSREYIDGGKTISDLFRDFQQAQKKRNKMAGKYCTFYKIFTKDFNISFFQPRKDQCDLCLQYLNSTVDQKVAIQEPYDAHLEEKVLSRQAKYEDRCNINDKNKVLVFDLQAVLQCPRGDTSAFFYKSKLNSYNFTVTSLNKKNDGHAKDSYEDVDCFFWNETDGKRSANELGSCLLKVFKKISLEVADDTGVDLILYSDNCCGQNKNKFIVALYLYAVTHLNINTITHKFLIKGHTQNEGDNIHSLIEKEIKKNLKTGPIYSPHQYVAIIKNAKKTGNKFYVHEQTFESFLDLKKLQEYWGPNFNKTSDGHTVIWHNLKIIRVVKSSPFSFYVKTSYKDNEYKEVCIRNRRKKLLPVSEIIPTKAYTDKQDLSENKKKDLRELIRKKLIPNFYSDFYNSIL